MEGNVSVSGRDKNNTGRLRSNDEKHTQHLETGGDGAIKRFLAFTCSVIISIFLFQLDRERDTHTHRHTHRKRKRRRTKHKEG